MVKNRKFEINNENQNNKTVKCLSDTLNMKTLMKIKSSNDCLDLNNFKSTPITSSLKEIDKVVTSNGVSYTVFKDPITLSSFYLDERTGNT